MRIQILESDFDPLEEVTKYQASLPAGQYGAMAMFVGTMRDFNEGDAVSSMLLEHYPEMTEKHLTELATSVARTHKLVDLLMMHRVGKIQPGEPIVLVAVWSKHRAAAFEACEAMVEDLKSRAPFWKKETLVAGESRWIEHNTAGPRSNA